VDTPQVDTLTTELLLCIALTVFGSIGMGIAHLAVTNERVEFPYGTLVSLLGLAIGVFLTWRWFGVPHAVSIIGLSLLVAVLLVRLAGRHAQFMWLVGQSILLSWCAWQLFEILESWSFK